MVRVSVFIVAIFLSFHSVCQNWVKIYGQGQNAVARCVISDYDRGFTFVGDLNYKYSWIFKTDVNGIILHNLKIGSGNYTVWSSNIERTIDNGYILSGTWTKFNSSFDAFIIKLNSCYEIEWCKTLITPTNYDMGVRVKPTPEGDFLLLGGYFSTNPVSNVSLFKFNSSGDLLWHQFYPLDNIDYNDQPYDVIVENDGYLIVTDRYYPDPGTTSPGIIRHHFIKTDTAGNQQWELVYGANTYFYGSPWTARKSTSGNYYEVGNQFIPDTGHAPAFVKVLHDGTQSYSSTLLSGTLGGGLASIDFLNDSLLVMVGGWTVNDTTYDAFFKTDTLGNVKKIKKIFHITSSYFSTAKTFDNKFITIGNDGSGGSWKIYAVKVNSNLEYDTIYNTPFTYDSLCPHPIVSETINPDCSNVYVGVEEPFCNPETTRMKVYPNPATDHVTIEMPKYLVVSITTGAVPSTTIHHQWGSVLLEVFDLNGIKVLEKWISRAEKEVMLNISAWEKGLYNFRLVYNKQQVASEKVIVQ